MTHQMRLAFEFTCHLRLYLVLLAKNFMGLQIFQLCSSFWQDFYSVCDICFLLASFWQLDALKNICLWCDLQYLPYTILFFDTKKLVCNRPWAEQNIRSYVLPHFERLSFLWRAFLFVDECTQSYINEILDKEEELWPQELILHLFTSCLQQDQEEILLTVFKLFPNKRLLKNHS